MDSKYWIEKLQLEKHPEGGYFREIYRSNDKFGGLLLPERYRKKSRTYFTIIYYLLEKEDFSVFHRLQSDEIWHFIDGCPLTICILGDKLEKRILGNGKHGSLFTVVPKLHWFGASINDKNSYSLVTCTVVPGFEYQDFELADREKLIMEYSQHKAVIKKLTK